MVQLCIELDSCLILWQNKDNWWHRRSESRCPNGASLWPSALNSCVVLGDVVVRLRQETKDYQGLKNSRCRCHMSWGTFLSTVFWCILFDWATLSVPVYWVDTSFSCQEHGFSDKAQNQTSLDAKSHEAGIWGFTMDSPFFTSVREICHVGNIWKRRHSGTWHWELRAEQRDSKIEGGSTPISVCWYLNIFNNINNVLYGSHDRCLENPSLCYLHGLSASWYQSGQCNDTT